jgi:hypothetical protein
MMRLVAAVFVLQLLSSMAAIFFLRTEMLEVVRSDRVRQVTDLRDDLLTAYYDGGRDELANFINAKRGSAADPTVFIALSGHGPTILNNLSRVPSISVSAQPHIVHIHRGPSLPETEDGDRQQPAWRRYAGRRRARRGRAALHAGLRGRNRPYRRHRRSPCHRERAAARFRDQPAHA